MTASVAPVRIERVRPHPPMRRRDQPPPGAFQPAVAGMAHEDILLLDLVDTMASSPLVVRWHAVRDRWAYARERWRQTTFYLFDADSWRR